MIKTEEMAFHKCRVYDGSTSKIAASCSVTDLTLSNIIAFLSKTLRYKIRFAL